MKHIFLYVIAAHLFIIASVFYVHIPLKKTPPVTPLLRTQTVVLNEIPKQETKEISPQNDILPTPIEKLLATKQEPPAQIKKPEVIPLPSKPKKKETVAKKPAVKKETPTPAKSTSNARLDQVAALMRQSLDKLEGSSKATSKKANSTPTSKIAALSSESLAQESTYQHDLVAYLEERLEFPEKGKVRIKLALKRDGSVQKLEIIDATSEKNRAFVEKHIPTFTFPAFGRNFGTETAHTFSITLHSENSR